MLLKTRFNRNTPLSENDCAFILAHYKKDMTTNGIAIHLGRPQGTIISAYQRLINGQCYKNRKYTPSYNAAIVTPEKRREITPIDRQRPNKPMPIPKEIMKNSMFCYCPVNNKSGSTCNKCNKEVL